jgi:hypothetical protein
VGRLVESLLGAAFLIQRASSASGNPPRALRPSLMPAPRSHQILGRCREARITVSGVGTDENYPRSLRCSGGLPHTLTRTTTPPTTSGRLMRSSCCFMRYARPSCEQCIRLAAEYSALFQQYLDASDALALTPKNDPGYAERRRDLNRVSGQLREARKRDDAHEMTHRDEFSN